MQSAEMIRLNCTCGRTIGAMPQFAGKKIRCPNCHAAHIVPAQENAELNAPEPVDPMPSTPPAESPPTISYEAPTPSAPPKARSGITIAAMLTSIGGLLLIVLGSLGFTGALLLFASLLQSQSITDMALNLVVTTGLLSLLTVGLGLLMRLAAQVARVFRDTAGQLTSSAAAMTPV